MTKTFSILFLFLFFVSCNGQDIPASCESADGSTPETCKDSTETPTPGQNPVEGTTTGGSTTGGTTGETTTTTGGSTTGETTTTTGGSTTGGTTGETTTTPPPPPPPTSTVPALALSWDADIYYVNFSATQQAKVERAVSLMKQVIASSEFKTEVHNHTYNGVKTFVDNNGLTNAQIYQIILDGAEKMGVTRKNNTMDVELELYYAATTTIGYTYPNSVRIWMNTKYFNNYTSVNVTGNLTHEWLHKLGFGHDASATARRPYSVPYAIGYMMERMAAKYQ